MGLGIRGYFYPVRWSVNPKEEVRRPSSQGARASLGLRPGKPLHTYVWDPRSKRKQKINRSDFLTCGWPKKNLKSPN